MSQEQIKLLAKIKYLIINKKRHFKIRNDRNYLDDLAELGISEEEAWKHILGLNINFYFIDPKPNYYKKKECLTFKKRVNDKIAYIKICLDENKKEVEAECWSFHEDRK